ncbi:hypothetical protein PCCS19_40380 [Paenibacillus sp. CCS19]|nr:VOC family protein [Paenibacillus cellulosilyticus]GMK40982.1 hypothetical protein PCCS19_40380 [Paenibacillus cellulosilyticus]
MEFSKGPCIDLWKTEDRTTSNFTVKGAPFPTIGIQVEDLDELAAAVIASGVDYEGDGTLYEDEEGNRFFRFFDPNGNMLVAHQLPAEVDDEVEQREA